MSGEALLELVLSVTEIMQHQHFDKQKAAANALAKKMIGLRAEQNVQREECERIENDKKEAIENVKRMERKLEIIEERQKSQMKRLEHVIDRLNSSQAVLSDAERKTLEELKTIHNLTKDFRKQMTLTESKYANQLATVSKGANASGGEHSSQSVSEKKQLANIKQMLKNEQTQIKTLVDRVNFLAKQCAPPSAQEEQTSGDAC